MARSSLPALVALSLVLSACGTIPSQTPPSGAAVAQRNGQLELTLASGSYSCDHGVRVKVEREIRDRVNYRIHIGWNGSSYWLERERSSSGLPRFADTSSGLVWIDLPWKSLLLDGRTNRPLADECRYV